MSVTAKGSHTGRAHTGARRDRLRVLRDALGKLAERASLLELRPLVVVSAIVVAYGLGSLAVLAMALENGTVALCAGAPAVAAWVTVVCLGETPEEAKLDETGRGEIANLSHGDFDRLVEEIEGSAAAEPARSPAEDEHFEQLVRDALDGLPDFVQAALEGVAVVVSDDGAKHGRYGLYHGGTVARGYWSNRIVIYRDTLVRDFGHDPESLRRNVEITVRHEVAHHLGASERRVAELGL